MFDLFTYLQGLLPCEGDNYIRAVYASTGLSAMEGVLDNARNPANACVLVDVGSDGSADFEDRHVVRVQQSFFVLERHQRDATAETIASILARTRTAGLSLTQTLTGRSYDLDFEGYGLDRSNIAFFSVGPIAGYYGYGFTLTFNADN